MNAMVHTTMPPTGISNARSSAHMTKAKAASYNMMDSIVCENDNVNLNLDLGMDMDALDQDSPGDMASPSSSRKEAAASLSSAVTAMAIALSNPVHTFC
jgi:hypothetical protein